MPKDPFQGGAVKLMLLLTEVEMHFIQLIRRKDGGLVLGGGGCPGVAGGPTGTPRLTRGLRWMKRGKQRGFLLAARGRLGWCGPSCISRRPRALRLCRTRPRSQIIWDGEGPGVMHSASPEPSLLAAGWGGGLQARVGKVALLRRWLPESLAAGTGLLFLLPLLRNQA